jgi:hypothetical protein
MTGPLERRFVIAGYPYVTDDKELRNSMMQTIINREESRAARGTVVIGVDVKRMDFPYSVLACRLETNLFT